MIKGKCWFTADTHFGHAKIIKLCNRPFSSCEEMDQTIIENINALVLPEDTLFHLGDFSFGPDRQTNNAANYLRRINCRNVIIIPGNHDPHYAHGLPKAEFGKLFAGCYPFFRLKTELDGNPLDIFMFHYSCRVWNKSHYGAWHLFGHSHGTLDIPDSSLSLDVGVDYHNFSPLSIEDIQKKMSKKTFVPLKKKGEDLITGEDFNKWAKANGH